MSINSIDTKSVNQNIKSKVISVTTDVENKSEAEEIKPVQQRLDTIELGNSNEEDTGTYTIDRKKIEEIKQDFSKNNETFKKMVQAMIEKQGLNVNTVIKSLSEGKDINITVDAKTQQAAQEAISADGYFGVDKTSERIVDFAKALSGGDQSKIDSLKNAFKEGYEQAKKAFGGELPEISQQTYDKVIAGFDAWQKEE